MLVLIPEVKFTVSFSVDLGVNFLNSHEFSIKAKCYHPDTGKLVHTFISNHRLNRKLKVGIAQFM